MHEKEISLVQKKLYIVYVMMIHLQWIGQTQVEKLTTTNDTNIWMSKCFDANVYSPPQEITNYIRVESYNIDTDSNNVDAQD
jgi:hypothetical protein